MITGPDFIFIFQSVIIVLAVFVIGHIVLSIDIEPRSLVFILIGLLAVQLTNEIEFVLFGEYLASNNYDILIGAPVIEEFVKFAFLFYIIQIDDIEPNEVMLSGILIGLGFSIGELIGYAILFGREVLLVRSILLIFGHPLFGAIIAYGWVLFKFRDQSFIWPLGLTIVSVLLHGTWNVVSIMLFDFLVLLVILHGIIWYVLIRNLYSLMDTTGSDKLSS